MYKDKKVEVIIPAAGSGRRMESGNINKVYIKLLGKTILERTVEVFENNPLVDSIIIAVKKEELDFCRENIIIPENHEKLKTIISGGKERCFTVERALEYVDDDSIVLIHDGARPLVENELINQCIEAVYQYGSCAAGVPVKDTIKFSEGDFYSETPDRSRLYAVQTPQGFIAGEIKGFMKKSFENGYFGTDEAVFAEKQGKKVFIVKGKYDNIKITTSEDIIIAEAVLMKRKG